MLDGVGFWVACPVVETFPRQPPCVISMVPLINNVTKLAGVWLMRPEIEDDADRDEKRDDLLK